jgi:hypothetical protein
MDPRHGPGGDIPRVEDGELAGRAVGRVDDRHGVAIAFLGRSHARREHHFTSRAARAEVEDIFRAGHRVEADHPVHPVDPAVDRLEVQIGETEA